MTVIKLDEHRSSEDEDKTAKVQKAPDGCSEIQEIVAAAEAARRGAERLDLRFEAHLLQLAIAALLKRLKG